MDDLFLQLTRNYKKRSVYIYFFLNFHQQIINKSLQLSTLKTLSAYSEAARHLLLQKNLPIDSSTGLRIAYLGFTGDVLFAIPGYQLETSTTTSIQETLQDVLEFLGDLDRAWLAVLQS